MDLDPRVVELELKSMEQADLLQKLNEALVEQQRELDVLRKAVEHLAKKVDVLPGQVDAAASEKPPHY
ncbi:MAG: SlyX family protein [Deltaproteobacteria bacterium]|nr:SlyX family protein [Deltaproteobacteria bacterium]